VGEFGVDFQDLEHGPAKKTCLLRVNAAFDQLTHSHVSPNLLLSTILAMPKTLL
jgi:hypothetical protein